MPNLPREKIFSSAAAHSSAAKAVDFRSKPVDFRQKAVHFSPKVVEKRLSHGFFRATLLLSD